VPLKYAQRETDGGLRFLEAKLSIYVQGPSAGRARRNPALDLLTGRVPDHRVPQAMTFPTAPDLPSSATPRTMVVALPRLGIAPRAAALVPVMAAPPAFAFAGVGSGSVSPWLQPAMQPAPAPRIRFAPAPARPRSSGVWGLILRLFGRD
jgi:hypothetical protein